MLSVLFSALGLLSLLATSAESGTLPLKTTGGDTLRYLFFGHSYNWAPGVYRTDPRIVELDFTRFDKTIIGGDVNSEALQRESNLVFLDSVFDLHSPNTHYVLGNHDARNENFEWYEEYTGRKTYSADARNGAVFFMLNTTLNPGDCESLDGQFRLLQNICDTITQSSHLLIFQHHGTWSNVPGILANPWSYCNWPLPFWEANCFGTATTFAGAIYPMLVEVQQRGVEVICVLGDAGVNNKGSAMQSTDGIWFLASGIDNTRYWNDSLALDTVPKDKVLIFEHLPAERKLDWKFHDLDSLHQAHQ